MKYLSYFLIEVVLLLIMFVEEASWLDLNTAALLITEMC